MKTRILTALVLLFVLLGSVVACAEVYTNPVYKYSVDVPDGWFAIDGAKAETLMKYDLDVYEYRDHSTSDMTGQVDQDSTIILLYEIEKLDDAFRSYINIDVGFLGEILPADYILSFSDAIVGLLKEQHEDYVVTVPAQKVKYNEIEAVFFSGEYMSGDVNTVLQQIIFTEYNYIYTLFLVTQADLIDTYEPLFTQVINSFTLP